MKLTRTVTKLFEDQSGRSSGDRVPQLPDVAVTIDASHRIRRTGFAVFKRSWQLTVMATLAVLVSGYTVGSKLIPASASSAVSSLPLIASARTGVPQESATQNPIADLSADILSSFLAPIESYDGQPVVYASFSPVPLIALSQSRRDDGYTASRDVLLPELRVVHPGDRVHLESLPRLRSFVSTSTSSDDHYQWLSLYGEVDAWHFHQPAAAERRWVAEPFTGVGFPHIEKSKRDAEDQYKPYKQLITWRDGDFADDRREPIAWIRCMGHSPSRIASRAERYESEILANALKYEVSASLIKAVITEESCFNPKAISHVGAQGLMQLMPATADWLNVKDAMDPDQNIEAGVRYLAMLMDRFDSLEHALAAYNAGPGAVRKYNGLPPYPETQRYVRRVTAYYQRYVAATRLAIEVSSSEVASSAW